MKPTASRSRCKKYVILKMTEADAYLLHEIVGHMAGPHAYDGPMDDYKGKFVLKMTPQKSEAKVKAMRTACTAVYYPLADLKLPKFQEK
jgi:hypothetical protein